MRPQQGIEPGGVDGGSLWDLSQLGDTVAQSGPTLDDAGRTMQEAGATLILLAPLVVGYLPARLLRLRDTRAIRRARDPVTAEGVDRNLAHRPWPAYRSTVSSG